MAILVTMKDKEIESLITEEKQRQESVINLIASENYVSQDVLEALGSELVNKYAEGYSALRYYGGNEVVDKIENLTIERALETFGLNKDELASTRGDSSTRGGWTVNVQPLSGSPANLAVYLALVPPGEKIMGMELSHGGHLTHGHKVSITGKVWQQVSYGVDKETEVLNYNEIKKIAEEEKPKLIVAGFTAYPRVIDWQKFREIADSCGAYLMVDMSHIAGLVAGGVYPSPFEYADVVTTTTHKTLRGPRAALIFSKKDDRELSKKINKAVFPGIQGGPHINQIAGVAVALKEAQGEAFKTYAKQVIENAQTLSDELAKLGWRVVSGGSDTHLLLVDTWMNGKGISGKEASDKLEKAGIIVNKNTIPFDERKPMDPSGIRLGTGAETTRGKTKEDFVEIAQKIDQILRS